MSGRALLVVDMQNDFGPGGALAVAGAMRVVPALNCHLERAVAECWTIYASRDWHPPVTSHFREFGGPWPAHCVQNTEGASFQKAVRLPADIIVITKGQDPEDHGYSAFDGTTPEGRPFHEDLRHRGIDCLYVAGLATDYCVKQSTLDALRRGLHVTLLTDAIAGVDPADSDRAIADMHAAGAELA